MPSICFVALNAYNIVSGREDLGHIGGAEVQQGLIARELFRRGYNVSFVTRDLGQPDGIEHEGIRVFKTCAEGDGLTGIRFVHPRWTSLCKAMRRADADIYYQRTGGLETGQVAQWCKRNRRRFVFSVAISYDCERSLRHLTDIRSRLLYRYGLSSADCVVVQTCEQQCKMQEEFGIASRVIRSCAKDPVQGGEAFLRPNGNPRLIWLGRFAPQKGLERLLELARFCPELDFDLLGNHDSSSTYARSIKQDADSVANVHLVGRVGHAQVDGFYRRAAYLVCTSYFEGFPNTFVEAWARGIPVVSTVDPDGLIMKYGLGFASEDIQQLAAFVHRANASTDLWQEYASNARRFFMKQQLPSIAADKYEELFMGLRCKTEN